MSYLKYSTLFLFFSTALLYSQNNAQTPANEFVKGNTFLHKLNQEKFSLHTNKTKYFSGETIWLKAYVANDVNEGPSYGTSNLHINVYDSGKKLIISQLLYASLGKAEGQIKLPIDLKSGDYYIQLETLSSQNFNNSYITPFQVINLKDEHKKENVESLEQNNNIELEFFPESCVLLENNENTIFFNINKSQWPIETKGDIYDEYTGEKVSSFVSDKNGIGSFKLKTSKGKKYYALINNHSKDVKYSIPESEEIGIVIHKKEDLETSSSISFSLQTNKATLEKEYGKSVFVVIHRRGFVLSAIPITLEKKYYSYNLKLQKKDLFNGINTITIFNQNNKPISERNFYNNKKEFIDIEVSKISDLQDSTSINLKLANSFIKTNLSISVLPERTQVYANQNNILSDFLITPYLEGGSSQVTSYISNRMDLINLDHFVQTKTTKNLKTKQYPKNESSKIKGENGLTISGNAIPINRKNTNCRVMLTSTENNLIMVSKLKPNHSFVFDSLLLKQSSNYKLALIDDKGKILKANFNLNQDRLKYRLDSISNKNLENYRLTKSDRELEQANKKSKSLNDLQQLDEIELKGNKKKIVFVDDYPDPKVRSSGTTKSHIIKEENYSQSQTALDVIQDLPGVATDIHQTRVMSQRGQRTMHAWTRNNEMAIIMNGSRVADFELLKQISAKDIIEIKVDATGAGYGLDGFGGVIILKTKLDTGYKHKYKKSEPNSKIGTTEFGFCIPKEKYSNHDLVFPTANSTKFYSTLDWIPNFELLPNTDNLLTVFNEGNKDIKLIINGCNENGDLIYQTISIPSSSD